MHFPWTPQKLLHPKPFLKKPHQSLHCRVAQKIAKIVMLKINDINFIQRRTQRSLLRTQRGQILLQSVDSVASVDFLQPHDWNSFFQRGGRYLGKHTGNLAQIRNALLDRSEVYEQTLWEIRNKKANQMFPARQEVHLQMHWVWVLRWQLRC